MWTRRRWLKSAAALAVSAPIGLPAGAQSNERDPDLILRLVAGSDRMKIWRGGPTAVLRYRGQVVRGRPDALRPSGSYLGPTLDLRRGERVRVHFENRLDEPSIIHWHGLIVPEAADGHPRFTVEPGGGYTYEFTVRNHAGTYLYHPHPHGRTGFQVYHGLAGLIVVRDRKERSAGLPNGPFELPLVLQDRRVGADNQLRFKGMMRDDMSGVLGDTVLINGKPDAAFNVASGSYRLRVVNASNARIYKLAWSDGRPLTIVGTDNGLLSASSGPQERPYAMLGPTERVEILEDFGSRRAGQEVALISQVFDSGTQMGMGGGMMDEGRMGGGMMGGGMMGEGMMSEGMMGGMMDSQGEEMLLARFSIRPQRRRTAEPLTLPRIEGESPASPSEFNVRLAFRHMRGFLNEREFEMTAVAPEERLRVHAPVVWTFEHAQGMNMVMPHPMHIHGVRFRILERQRDASAPDVAEGLIDDGFKDTVLVFPGERVRVLVQPTETGLFMYHCHNLEHEDGGMMRNYRVS